MPVRQDPSVQRMLTEIMELLVTHYGGGMSEEQLDESIQGLTRAFNLAVESHEGQFRRSGEPYLFHPLRVAHLAARHWMDFPSVIAALLHDVVEDTSVTLEQVRQKFGDEVGLLVDGLTKVKAEKLGRDKVKDEVYREQTYRKQILLAVRDVRVLVLKFWDRYNNLQTISALPPQKQARIAEETRAVYVPLASHLGMGYVASELDALSLEILYPKRARRYHQEVEQMRQQMEPVLRDAKARLHNALQQQKIDYSLRDRWRSFSIAAARTMGRGFAWLYTLDIAVNRTMEAYIALGTLHSLYPPIPGKLRDHLYAPSHHGYQSIKTSVQVGGVRMRVEITTRKLARFNEAGVLAPGFEFQKHNFRELMHSLLEGEAVFDTESLRLASGNIRVYTPRGDVLTLPEGSSALDFAFSIHQGVGLHARRARINGQTRLLKSKLMDGDQVNIERDPQPQVLPKWLEWAVTPKARNAIRRYLRDRVRHEQPEPSRG